MNTQRFCKLIYNYDLLEEKLDHFIFIGKDCYYYKFKNKFSDININRIESAKFIH